MTHISSCILRATSAAALLVMAQAALAATPTIDANIELDSTYNSGNALESNTLGSDKTGMDQSGRLELNISQKAGDQYFVAGRATFLAKKDSTAGTDDLWAQLGTKSASIKLGRFEAADLFPIQQDTVVIHADSGKGVGSSAVYTGNTLRGRSTNFHAAGIFTPGGPLSFELGLIDATDSALGTTGVKGVRPVVTYASGPLSVTVGAEFGKYLSSRNLDGFGASLGYSAGMLGLKLNLAQGKQDRDSDNKLSTFGINVLYGQFAAGIVSAKNDQQVGKVVGDNQIQTIHASYNIPIFGVKGASITPAISHSSNKNSITGTTSDVDAIRVRVHYDF